MRRGFVAVLLVLALALQSADALCGGETYKIVVGTTCAECDPGFVPSSLNADAICVSCPRGTYRNEQKQVSCTPAQPGRIADPSGYQEVVCPAGTYSDTQGAQYCKRCPAGTSSAAGATSCTLCEESDVDHDHDPSTPCISRKFGTPHPVRNMGNSFHNFIKTVLYVFLFVFLLGLACTCLPICLPICALKIHQMKRSMERKSEEMKAKSERQNAGYQNQMMFQQGSMNPQQMEMQQTPSMAQYPRQPPYPQQPMYGQGAGGGPPQATVQQTQPAPQSSQPQASMYQQQQLYPPQQQQYQQLPPQQYQQQPPPPPPQQQQVRSAPVLQSPPATSGLYKTKYSRRSEF